MCPPLLVALIPAIATIAGAGISAASSSSNANKSAAQANAANAVMNQQWGQEMKQKNYEFDQTQQQKKMEDFQSALDRYPSLQKSMINIWGGGQ